MRLFRSLALAATTTLFSLSALSQTLVVGDQSYNTRTVMEASGVLEGVPYEIDWKQFTAGSPVAEALNVGSLDLGFLGDAPSLFVGALNAPIKIVAVSRQSLDGIAILVRKDSPIQTLADLRGTRAAIWKGSWSQQLLFKALDREGIARDDLKLSYLSALDASHALEGGSVDVIATWEPYVTQAQRQGARVLTTAQGLIPAQAFIVANDKALASKREIIADFLQRLKRARQWALADPANTDLYASAWAKNTRADEQVARAWFARARTDIGPVTPAAIEQAQQTADFFAEQGLVSGYPVKRLFDDSFSSVLAPETASVR